MDIKITADKKLLETLEKIATALSALVEQPSVTILPEVPQKAPQTPEPDEVKGKDDQPAEPGKTEDSPAASEHALQPLPTRAEIQQLAIVKIQGGHRDAVKDLIKKHGGTRVGDVSDANLLAFKKDLEVLA